MSEIRMFDSTTRSARREGIIPEGKVLVTWPLSQDLMVEPWFGSEAELVIGETLVDIFGPAAYVVPRRHVRTDQVGVHTPKEVNSIVAAKK